MGVSLSDQTNYIIILDLLLVRKHFAVENVDGLKKNESFSMCREEKQQTLLLSLHVLMTSVVSQ